MDYIENNTWVRRNTRFILSVEHDISRVSAQCLWQCVLQQMIFSHIKILYFLRVFKYDFSQWPKTLYNTYVYIINIIILHS
jgi:ABC-type Mn2+/Zn2+ transport system ATPase subunit